MSIVISDHIIEGCIHGDRKSQHDLYKLCFQFLARICRRYVNHDEDVVDLLNQSFIKVLANIKSFRRSESFEAWSSTIAIHVSIDHIRKTKRYRDKVALSGDFKTELFDYDTISYNMATSKMHANDIMKLIQQLPEITREVLNLNVIDGYAHREISQMLGISEEASRWHLHKARQILKKKLLAEDKIKVA